MRRHPVSRGRPVPGSPGKHWRQGIFACPLLLATFFCVAQDGQAPVNPGQPGPNAQAAPNTTAQPPAQQNERKKQITDQSSQLLTMAIALKAELDKTNKDTLSLNVIRKADEIERLARTVKEKTK